MESRDVGGRRGLYQAYVARLVSEDYIIFAHLLRPD